MDIHLVFTFDETIDEKRQNDENTNLLVCINMMPSLQDV